MNTLRYPNLTRRGFLRAAGLGLTGAGAGAVLGCGGDDAPADVPVAPEGPPEVRTILLPAYDNTATCLAPMAVASDFLREEGIEPEYVTLRPDASWTEATARGSLDISQDLTTPVVVGAARKHRFTILGPVHSGCTELFARRAITSVPDLAGKRVGIPFGANAELPQYAFMLTLLNFVGVPAGTTIASYDYHELPSKLQSGEVDAVLAIAPTGENLRGLDGVHVILDTRRDTPWSNYYCCVFYGGEKFVKKYPIATKRALRALYRAVDLCARDPERVARMLADAYQADYDVTLRILRHLPYDGWRTIDPTDTLLFHTIRLREVGEIRMSPGAVLRRSDWRYLEQLQKEMPLAWQPATSGGRFALDCTIEGPGESPG